MMNLKTNNQQQKSGLLIEQQQTSQLSTIQKIAGIGGMASPIVYTFLWILGGIVTPGYNHIRDDVSTLMATGAPYKLLFDALNIISTLLGVVFYVGILTSFKKQKFPTLGPILLSLLGLVGILVSFFFPLDEGGEITSVSGLMHLILVMCMPLLVLGATLAMWRGLKNVPSWKGYDRFALLSFVLVLILGLFGVMMVGSDLMGLGERLAALSTQQFTFVIALKLFREGKDKDKPRNGSY